MQLGGKSNSKLLRLSASLAAPLLEDRVVYRSEKKDALEDWFAVGSIGGMSLSRQDEEREAPQAFCSGLIIFWQLCNCISPPVSPLRRLSFHTHGIKYGNALN